MLRGFVVALALLAPASALAGPITPGGVWSSALPTTSASALQGDPIPFWAGTSWDCATCGIGFLLNFGSTPGLEYLHNGSGGSTAFGFDGTDIIDSTLLFNITAWKGGTFGRMSNGGFSYDSGTNRLSNSWATNGGQYALFRIRGPETTQYFLGIEDILLSETLNDRDYNDYVVSFTLPTPVPEPGTMLLLGGSLAALIGRRARAARKARSKTSELS
jgi:hypothetical protein